MTDHLLYFRTDWSVMSVTGPDSASFLHNLCTNDIKKLESRGPACEAFFTDVKGHVLAHTVVGRSDSGFEVVVTSGASEDLAQHCEKYHIREDLELSVNRDAVVVVSNDIIEIDDELEGLRVKGSNSSWWPTPGLGQCGGLGIELPNANFAGLKGVGWTEMSAEEFNTYRIEQGFPLDRVDVDSSNLPQEVNRDPLAISFTKGCYLGQETVARIDALGHVNRKLVSLRFDGQAVPAPGAPLTKDGKDVGRVTSACWSEKLAAPLALGYVRREHCEAGSVLQFEGGLAVVQADGEGPQQ